MRADRLRRLPPYLFVEMARAKERLRASGREVLDLGIGDPEDPTPDPVVGRMRAALGDPRHHRYPGSDIERRFTEAAARWMRRRFGVELDPASQILPLLGTKEGIGHLCLALVNPGEAVLVPDPGYPVYTASAVFAGAETLDLPLREEDGFLPRLEEVPAADARRARLLFLNYPNNPTGATCDEEFFCRAAAWAAEREVVLAHDAAYSEVGFDGYRAPSALSAVGGGGSGARVVEFHSFSKTWNMCGWRVGFAAGDAEAVGALAALKSNLDSGVFGAVLETAAAALDDPAGPPPSTVREYEARRDLLLPALARAGWVTRPLRGSFYVWARTPRPCGSMALAAALLERYGVATAPGVGFGARGEGYIRFSLTARTEVVARAAEALGRAEAGELAAAAAAHAAGAGAR